MNNSSVQLIAALDYLKNHTLDETLSENFRNVFLILSKTNSALGNAWMDIDAAYSNVCHAVDAILSGVYSQTNSFAMQTMLNEKRATESAEMFMNSTSGKYDSIIKICNKYGISGND